MSTHAEIEDRSYEEEEVPAETVAAEEQLAAIASAIGDEARGPVTDHIRQLLKRRQAPRRKWNASRSHLDKFKASRKKHVDDFAGLATRIRMRLQAAICSAELQRWMISGHRQNKDELDRLSWQEFYSLCRKVLKVEDPEVYLRALFAKLDRQGSGSTTVFDVFIFAQLPFHDLEAMLALAVPPADESTTASKIGRPHSATSSLDHSSAGAWQPHPNSALELEWHTVLQTRPVRTIDIASKRTAGTKRVDGLMANWQPLSKEERDMHIKSKKELAAARSRLLRKNFGDLDGQLIMSPRRYSSKSAQHLRATADTLIAQRMMKTSAAAHHSGSSGYSIDPQKGLSYAFNSKRASLQLSEACRNDIVATARAYKIPPTEMVLMKRIFDRLDADRSGMLGEEEFAEAVQKLIEETTSCVISEDIIKDECRKHFQLSNSDRNDGIDFPEFLIWFAKNRFNEDLLLSEEEKEMRDLAEAFDMELNEVEQIRAKYCSYDMDQTGLIDFAEFSQLMYEVLKVPCGAEIPPERMKFYWNQIDKDESGKVDFEEFLPWWARRRYELVPYEKFYLNVRNLATQELDPPAQPIPSRNDVRVDPWASTNRRAQRAKTFEELPPRAPATGLS